MAINSVTHPIRADVPAVTQTLVEAAAAAGYAPSIHNAQPWRWRLTGDTLDLFADHRRVVAATDAHTRLATLSCGAALHHARVGVAAQGWHATVVRIPDPADPTHLAQLHVDGPAPVNPAAVRHVRTIPLRHTDRRRVAGSPVGLDDLQAITASAESEGTRLCVLRPAHLLELATAASHAQRTEATGSGWRAELAYWTSVAHPTGIGGAGSVPLSAEHDHAAAFAMLYGRHDDPLNWLRAGEALSAAWLTATELGVSVLPLSATIEVAGTRETMRRMVSDPGYPYLMLRLGATDSDDAIPQRPPRLPADQVIEQP